MRERIYEIAAYHRLIIKTKDINVKRHMNLISIDCHRISDCGLVFFLFSGNNAKIDLISGGFGKYDLVAYLIDDNPRSP